MTTAKELLLAAGWSQIEDGVLHFIHINGGEIVLRYDIFDDNLTDMLIRDLSEEQLVNYRNKLCELLDVGTLVCWVPVILATPEQKAQALMETYKERP